jgi:hypothetical protein
MTRKDNDPLCCICNRKLVADQCVNHDPVHLRCGKCKPRGEGDIFK